MLFLKEMKKAITSITFIVFLVAAVIFLVSQDMLELSDVKFTPPRQGEDYGMQRKEVPELIMPAAFDSLCNEFAGNSYVAYPIGFYKNVKLNKKKQGQMEEIISALSGEAHIADGAGAELRTEITYEEFKEYMRQADRLIGGGSKYSEDYLADFSYVPITFEEAKEQYRLTAETDRFTGGYARLFCDYLGVIVSFLPVFIAVAICLKDRHAGMSEMVYARKTSSLKLMVTRYFVILAAVMLPSLILAYISNISVWGLYDGEALDYFAPLKYVAGWLMPSAMMAIAVGMLFTELTGTPVAIAVQGIWWFLDAFSGGVKRMEGYQSLFQLSPRHNSYESTQIFIDNFPILAANRLLYAAASLFLVLITVVIFEQKRRGKINGFEKVTRFLTDLADRKSKFAA